MPLVRQPTRYAHPEGHTDVCYYTGEKKGLVTCGADGDVRSWLNLMDDDPTASCIAEQAIAVVSKNGKIYVGNDNNTVQILTYPDLEKEGIITRFSASVSALATAKDSKYIVSGSCDMRIHVTDVNTSDNIELEGHAAPILGLSLDPKEEFVASSSADGSIKVWSIKEKRAVNTWNNVVPKDNSFFTAKVYGTPSFHTVDGSCLAYPSNKDVIVVERSLWKESFRLKCSSLRTDLSICKFSECATRLAATSVYGEIVVWDMNTKLEIGYIEHQQNTKITSIAWNLDKPNEIAFCDAAGQLGCVNVHHEEESNKLEPESVTNENDQFTKLPSDDEDDENVISLEKIKASVDLEDDQKSVTSASVRSHGDREAVLPEVNLQPPFQPGSSPDHLLSRFMVWNDTGMVRCFTSEDGEECSIEVEFHDVSIHHSMHINNYLKHTIAALSPKALALNCPSSDETPSKLVVVALQGWGSGTKEWSIDLPDGEQGECLAAGDNFVALSTSKRNLRLYMVGGTQREVIALPGPSVAMNALGNRLIVAYHSGVGVGGDQVMSLLWIHVRGANLRSETLSVPLSPSSNLMWLGFSDLGSPSVMDAEDVIKIYDRKSRLWRVACNMTKQNKGLTDHYFLTGVSEEQRIARGVLCKGSYYPPTTPRPIISEIPLTIPLCDPDSGKTGHETKLWRIGGSPIDENEAVLSLIALACRSNVEYRAVELCEEIASLKVLDLAVQYARRMSRIALAKKLESIIEIKDQEKETEKEAEESNGNNHAPMEDAEMEEDEAEPILTPALTQRKSEVEIRPLSMNESLSLKKNNPFVKSAAANATKGLAGLDSVPDKVQKLEPMKFPFAARKPQKPPSKKESFVSWYSKNKKSLQEEFPHLSSAELSKTALQRYNEKSQEKNTENDSEGKKRKLSNLEDDSSQPKRSNTILNSFAFNK